MSGTRFPSTRREMRTKGEAADVDEIIYSPILGGKPVERLMTPDSCLNAERCPHKPRRREFI
jgi:hypothetical protein